MPGMASTRPLRRIGVVVLVGLIAACSGKPGAAPAGGVSSMQSIEIKPGTGEAITAGKIAVVQYTGWLYEAAAKDNKGKQFDTSRTRGQPFRFPVGAGQVIKGWDQGVVGMKVGDSRRPCLRRQRRRRRDSAGRDFGVRHRSRRRRMSSAPERLFIEGQAGALEAIVEETAVPGSSYGIVCHPHPLFGGTMDNKVVTTVARALHETGIP